MNVRSTEVIWLDSQEEVTLATLAELSGLSDVELKLLTELGALVPLEGSRPDLCYRAECIVTARRAFRLRQDLELSTEGLALVLKLLDRLQGMEVELRNLRARSPGR